ncbi:unnamed protein product [Triticum turgidum subsp. durum]|uniref:Disease resistance N-terminal domain-containing protein n=2 Tax=Triticum turgidum subsp. durum TaxID=4567 RepID=A0A9R0W5S2_TRITD|nr:unnamed protein product [Triticum turgidum subsp. durum]
MEFVVGASEATMRSLLGKLGGLLAQEYTLIRGVCSIRGDIQYINDELASMQAFLSDLGSALDDHDRRLKNWMKQIRDMAYDMEDCIDDFAHRLPQDSLSDARCSFIVTIVYGMWTFWPRRDIASKIAELKVRAQYIAERRSSIKSSVKRVVPLLSGHRPQSNDGSMQNKIETMNRDQLIEELGISS